MSKKPAIINHGKSAVYVKFGDGETLAIPPMSQIDVDLTPRVKVLKSTSKKALIVKRKSR